MWKSHPSSISFIEKADTRIYINLTEMETSFMSISQTAVPLISSHLLISGWLSVKILIRKVKMKSQKSFLWWQLNNFTTFIEYAHLVQNHRQLDLSWCGDKWKCPSCSGITHYSLITQFTSTVVRHIQTRLMSTWYITHSNDAWFCIQCTLFSK